VTDDGAKAPWTPVSGRDALKTATPVVTPFGVRRGFVSRVPGRTTVVTFNFRRP
jgi:hypothetical protein